MAARLRSVPGSDPGRLASGQEDERSELAPNGQDRERDQNHNRKGRCEVQELQAPNLSGLTRLTESTPPVPDPN